MSGPEAPAGGGAGSHGGAGRAWGWVAHLRAGGSTPWARWHDEAPASGPVLPGAQQLELLRRVNLARESSALGVVVDTEARTRLADRILRAPTAGRGWPDLPLLGAEQSSYGPASVDPEALSAHELTRVAATLLARDLVSLGVPPPVEPLGRPWRRRYRLVGDPLVGTAVRAELTSRGRPPGGPRPVVVVVAAPFDELLAHTWTRRCFEHGANPLDAWLRFWRERGQVPPRLELAEQAALWATRRSQVRVVTDHERLPAELGTRRLAPVHVPGADAAELARRIAAVVGFLVPPEERPQLMSRTLLTRMPHTTTPPVALPESERGWIERAAARVARQLRTAGYPVAGDLADLAPRFAAQPVDDLDERVLDLAVTMLVDPGWRSDAAPDRRTTEGQATR